MSKIPERFLWATEMLDIQADQNILEIGCGAGLLAEQINKKLTDGKFTAVDKSVAMVQKAIERNCSSIELGKANFIISDFRRAELPKLFFDSIVAFNVNFFWKDSKIELALIRTAIKKTGRLFVFYEYPFEIDVTAAEPIKKKLKENNYKIVATKFQEFGPASAFCIIAKP